MCHICYYEIVCVMRICFLFQYFPSIFHILVALNVNNKVSHKKEKTQKKLSLVCERKTNLAGKVEYDCWFGTSFTT